MKNSNRKYYLKQRLKDVLNVKTSQKEVVINEELINSLDDKKKSYLFELRDKFGYNLQFTML